MDKMKILVSGFKKTSNPKRQRRSGMRRKSAVAVLLMAFLLLGAVALQFLSDENADMQNAEPVYSAITEVTGASAVEAAIGTLGNFGATTVEEAVEIWAEGVCGKNGLTQYSVMTADLKEKYLDVIQDNYGDMLFPVSDETIDSWFVENVTEDQNGSTIAKLRFTISGASGSNTASAELQLVEDSGYISVSAVAVESPLYEFTGLMAF